MMLQPLPRRLSEMGSKSTATRPEKKMLQIPLQIKLTPQSRKPRNKKRNVKQQKTSIDSETNKQTTNIIIIIIRFPG
jgi:hypothetical protein